MRPTKFLIDGYNLLHAAGLGRSTYAIGELQRAREKLLTRLQKMLSGEHARDTVVVFDARDPPPDRPATAVISGIRVMFAIDDGDADAMVEQLIAQHTSPKKLTVVSSDHRLQNAARRRKAKFVDSDSFLATLEHQLEPRARTPRQKEGKVPNLKEQGASSEDLAHWMTVFGDIPTKLPPKSRSHRQTPAIPEKTADGLNVTDSPPASTTAPPTPPPAAPPAGDSRAENAKSSQSNRKKRQKSDKPRTPPEPETFSDDWVREMQDWVDNLPP